MWFMNLYFHDLFWHIRKGTYHEHVFFVLLSHVIEIQRSPGKIAMNLSLQGSSSTCSRTLCYCPIQPHFIQGSQGAEFCLAAHSRDKKGSHLVFFLCVKISPTFSLQIKAFDSPWSSCDIIPWETASKSCSGLVSLPHPRSEAGSRAFFVGGGERLLCGDDAILTKLKVPKYQIPTRNLFEEVALKHIIKNFRSLFLLLFCTLSLFFLFRLGLQRIWKW